MASDSPCLPSWTPLTLWPMSCPSPHCRCQVAEHVQEQLREVDAGMSKPTAESLFQLYLNLQELYKMKDFLPKRYQPARGVVLEWGTEQSVCKNTKAFALTPPLITAQSRPGVGVSIIRRVSGLDSMILIGILSWT